MSTFIKTVKATGIYDRFDLELNFNEGVNVLYGKNGTGKTTLLHILTNAINLDVDRFLYLSFKEIEVILSSGDKILINHRARRRVERGGIQLLFNGEIKDFISGKDIRQSREMRERKLALRRQQISRMRKELDYYKIATYFPAFRTMIEAWSSVEYSPEHYSRPDIYDEPYRRRRLRRQDDLAITNFARRLFGQFIPTLTYPSPLAIEADLNSEIRDAIFDVTRTDKNLLADAFVKAFSAISGGQPQTAAQTKSAEEILENIKNITRDLETTPFKLEKGDETVYARLREHLKTFQLSLDEPGLTSRILSIYEESLKKRAKTQTNAFEAIEAYFEAVNEFLDNKELIWGAHRGPNEKESIAVKFKDGRVGGLQMLSSGERQIIGLIYSASHIQGDSVVLIDEPELSLHIDWQSIFLPEIQKQLGGKQLIVCTHSPVIAASIDGPHIEIIPEQTSEIPEQSSFLNDEEDDSEDKLMLDDEIPF